MKSLHLCTALLLATCVLTAQQTAKQQRTHVPTRAFTVPDGLEVQVWATSPLLRNPTNIDVDHHGRIWVTESSNYLGKSKRHKAGDRVVVLQDTDQDGKADRSTVFVQEPFLVSPLGIAVFDNVIVVSQPPDMVVYTDVDRNLNFDPLVDKREVRLTGFQGHEHGLHSVTAGPDGKWYWNSGNGGAVFTDTSGKTFRIPRSYNDPQDVAGQSSDDGHRYVGGFTARMNPDGSNVEIIAHNYGNSFEPVVTSLGDVFQSDGVGSAASRVSHVLEHGNAGFLSRNGKRTWRTDQRRGQDLKAAQWRQEDPGSMPAGDVYGGGSPTGVAFYENGALDKKWCGLLLTCDPARNAVFGYQPVREGAGFKLERMDWMTCNPEPKTVGDDVPGGGHGKRHTQFRPSDVTVGPDGAIYVSDWFDDRVGDNQRSDGSPSGTIYRIAPKGFVSTVPKIHINDLKLSELTEETIDETVEGILEAVRSPATNVRHLGVRRLQEGHLGNPLTIPDRDASNVFVRARVFWLMPLYGEHGIYTVETTATHCPDAELRLVAFRALRRAGHDTKKLTAQLCDDEAAFVRAAVATALRDVPAKDSVNALITIANGFDGKDRRYLEALGIGCTGKESAVYTELAKHAGDPVKWSPATAWIAWRLGAPESVPALVARVHAPNLSLEERTRALTAIAFIKHKPAMHAMIGIANASDCSLRDEALLWCLRRLDNEWQQFGLSDILKEKGMYDAETVRIQPVSVPTAPATQQISVEQVLSLKGIAKNGAARLTTCYTCHKIGNVGIAFGPDIVSFAKSQSRQAVAEAILAPSKSIRPGFEGHTIETAEGNIDGIVLSRGDPVIVQSQGGMRQMIPKNRVKKIRPLGRSLMGPAQLYGLDAQAVADVIAYLNSLTDR